MAATLQFVDSIGASPTLRLDINDGTIWLLEADGTDFSPPSLKTASADILLTDGAYRSASSYENRRLKLRLSLKATSEDDKATKLRALHVELNRACNFLKYQPGTTTLFFRTLRAPGYVLDETETYALTYVDLDIEAEPFAYGLRVDQTGVSVKANPALTNGCYLDVNGVTGDVETPAYVALSAGTVTPLTSPSYMSVRRHGTPATLQFIYQAESVTQAIDTAVTASNDATASGAGNNTSTTTFATQTGLTNRLAITLSEGVETHGKFRVLVRVAKTVGSDTVTVLALPTGTPTSTPVTPATLPGNTSWNWVDCGLVSFPQFTDDVATGYSGVYPPLSTAGTLTLYGGRTAGTGSLKWDAIALLPADEELTVFSIPGAMIWTGTNVLVLDGPNDAMYQLQSGTQISARSGVGRAGSFPRLRPGSNRIYFIENTTNAVIGDSSTVTVSFWPRYLIV